MPIAILTENIKYIRVLFEADNLMFIIGKMECKSNLSDSGRDSKISAGLEKGGSYGFD